MKRFSGRGNRGAPRILGGLPGVRAVASAVVLSSLILALGSAAIGQQPREQEILKEVGFDQRLNEPVPLDARFRDDTGREVRLGDYLGKKPIVLALVYYECPMLCTLTLNGLVGALKAVSFNPGEQFDVVAVSINPRETPELAAKKKANYLERYGRPGTEGGWHFLTGEQQAIESLARAVGFRYRYLPEKKQYAHAAGIMIVTPQGRLARYFYGVEFSPRDLRLGLIEASRNRIGNAVDQVLLYCFQYDPKTGQYGAVVVNVLRLVAAVTVVVLGSFLLISWRRDRAGQGSAGRGSE